MTPAEWLNCTEPEKMLQFLGEDAGPRKLRLFACACCRHIWKLLWAEGQNAVEVAERFADGWATAVDLHLAQIAAYRQVMELGNHAETGCAHWQHSGGPTDWLDALYREQAAAEAVAAAAWEVEKPGAASSWVRETNLHQHLGETQRFCRLAVKSWSSAATNEAEQAEQIYQASVLKDLIPTWAHELAVSWLTWNGGAIQRLAQTAYDERDLPAGTLDPARLAILADALEEAGCTNSVLLSHLRSSGLHYRGCWAVDLLLKKE